MEINKKIEQVFAAFNVDHVWTDEKEVFLTEKENCRKVSKNEVINQSKIKK